MSLQRTGLTNQAQLQLPRFTVALANRSHQAIGRLGELTALALLRQSKYEVSQVHPGEMRGDLRAIDPSTGTIYRVEVKTARKGSDNKWRFQLYKKGHCDHRHSDYVILLAVLESGRVIPFVIPIAALAEQHQAVITSHPEKYAGKLAQYRAAGGAIEL